MANLSDKDKEMLLSLKPKDVTYELISELFLDRCTKVKSGNSYKMKEMKSRLNTFDTFTLKAKEYINKKDVVTNCGRFLFNKLIIEDLINVFGDYQNITINKKELGRLDSIMAKALQDDVIKPEQFIRYLNCIQWLGLSLTSSITSSFTPGILTPNKKVIALRDKLFKENTEAIKNGDISIAHKIEQECIGLAKEELKNDDGMYLYKAGARGSFDNNYKNISIMKGPVLNPMTGEYDIIKNNYVEGHAKEDLAVHGNSVITGSYPKAIGQRTFGYFTKQITSALQSTVLDEPGSDCHSKVLLEVTIDPSNISEYEDRWIVEGGKYVLLDEKTLIKYKGKTVHMRSPMYCKGRDKICRICAGRKLEKLEIENIGLTASRASSTMSNASMKKFHDTTIKMSKLSRNTLTT